MYPIKNNPAKLLKEIQDALDGVVFGSVEIYVQDGKVTQISRRDIKKTNLVLSNDNKKPSATDL